MGLSLASADLANLDVSSPIEVLRYVHSGDTPLLTYSRLDLSWPNALVSNIDFGCFIFINSIEAIPEFPIAVTSGASGFIGQTGPDILLPGDTLTLWLSCPTIAQLVNCAAEIVIDNPDMSDILNQIGAVVTQTLSKINLSPERVVLGPCARQVKSFQLPLNR